MPSPHASDLEVAALGQPERVVEEQSRRSSRRCRRRPWRPPTGRPRRRSPSSQPRPRRHAASRAHRPLVRVAVERRRLVSREDVAAVRRRQLVRARAAAELPQLRPGAVEQLGQVDPGAREAAVGVVAAGGGEVVEPADEVGRVGAAEGDRGRGGAAARRWSPGTRRGDWRRSRSASSMRDRARAAGSCRSARSGRCRRPCCGSCATGRGSSARRRARTGAPRRGTARAARTAGLAASTSGSTSSSAERRFTNVVFARRRNGGQALDGLGEGVLLAAPARRTSRSGCRRRR